MAEVLGLIVTATALVETASSIVIALHSTYVTLKDAPEAIQRLSRNLEVFQGATEGLLTSLNSVHEKGGDIEIPPKAWSYIQKAVDNCQHTLVRVQKLLPSQKSKTGENTDSTSIATRVDDAKVSWRREWIERLQYWLNRSELKEILVELETEKSTLHYSTSVLHLQLTTAGRPKSPSASSRDDAFDKAIERLERATTNVSALVSKHTKLEAMRNAEVAAPSASNVTVSGSAELMIESSPTEAQRPASSPILVDVERKGTLTPMADADFVVVASTTARDTEAATKVEPAAEVEPASEAGLVPSLEPVSDQSTAPISDLSLDEGGQMEDWETVSKMNAKHGQQDETTAHTQTQTETDQPQQQEKESQERVIETDPPKVDDQTPAQTIDTSTPPVEANELDPEEQCNFMDAIMDDDLTTLRRLLSERPRRIDINEPVSGLKQPPLTVAVLQGSKDIVSALIEAGADLERHDKNGWAPLAHALLENNIDLMTVLLAGGADALPEEAPTWNVLNRHGDSYLAQAVVMRRKDAVRLLLRSGVDVHHPSHIWSKGHWLWETTLLHLVSGYHGDAELMRILLETGVDPNDTAATMVPLEHAIRSSATEQIELLIEYGADLDLRSGIREAVEGNKEMRKVVTKAEMRRELKRKKQHQSG